MGDYFDFFKISENKTAFIIAVVTGHGCLLYTSDAADDLLCLDLGGRRMIKKKKTTTHSLCIHFMTFTHIHTNIYSLLLTPIIRLSPFLPSLLHR